MLKLSYYSPNQSHKQILLYIILFLSRLKKKVETELADKQAGFRASTGTADIFGALHILIEKIDDISITNNTSKRYIVFTDYNMAFDNVSHGKLFEKLAEMGFSPHLKQLGRKNLACSASSKRPNGQTPESDSTQADWDPMDNAG
ncbi:hypothetical protein RRG08_052009 [Elysia crispata]|uniref:Reverse transcriptase domain-containing protein n=1 Tax=Elysia crispata TaxID=231223 RepID=A0AAE0ZDF0_9GAST|nr:hypothetical protein RRG08_052009 [Elysia crispata]